MATLMKYRLNETLLDNFDVSLQFFFFRVLNKEMRISSLKNSSAVKKALKEVVDAYSERAFQSLSSSIEYDSIPKRVAYILKHSTCFTSAVAHHFCNLLRQNPDILDNVIRRHQLNLCCFGGGPATDAVAIVKVVNFLNFVTNFNREKLAINITVVDLCKDWKKSGKQVIKTLKETPEFCDTSIITLRFRFLQADLTEEFEQPLNVVLKNADVVTMVYFISAVNGSKAMPKCSSMLQRIMNQLKPEAMVFFLDSLKKHYRDVSSAASHFEDIKQIYGPYLKEFHCLSMTSIREFLHLYPAEIRLYMCLTNCFISCSAWLKVLESSSCENNKKIHVSPKTVSPSMTKGLNSELKIKKYNAFKQECYREKMYTYFKSEFDYYFTAVFIDSSFDSDDDYDHVKNFYRCDRTLLNSAKSKRKRIFTGIHV